MDTHNPILEQEALAEGLRAGTLMLPASLNPYQDDSAEHREWERGRMSASARRLAAQLRERARTNPCPYRSGRSCTCGGRGICLDVA